MPAEPETSRRDWWSWEEVPAGELGTGAGGLFRRQHPQRRGGLEVGEILFRLWLLDVVIGMSLTLFHLDAENSTEKITVSLSASGTVVIPAPRYSQ